MVVSGIGVQRETEPGGTRFDEWGEWLGPWCLTASRSRGGLRPHDVGLSRARVFNGKGMAWKRLWAPTTTDPTSQPQKRWGMQKYSSTIERATGEWFSQRRASTYLNEYWWALIFYSTVLWHKQCWWMGEAEQIINMCSVKPQLHFPKGALIGILKKRIIKILCLQMYSLFCEFCCTCFSQ